VELRLVETNDGQVDVNRLVEAIDSRTRIVAVSWVGYASGWRLDLAAIARAAHDRGALLLVDAIQGLGVFPLDVQRIPIDFLAADGHKWMLGPEGAGLFFIRHQHLSLLRPLGVGWNSVSHAFDFDTIELDLRDEAARYEGGSQNMVGFIGLRASLGLLREFGLSADTSPIADRVLQLGDYAAEQLQAAGAKLLTPRPKNHRSGIITFQLPGSDPHAVRLACQRAKIAVSCRGGGVRISPHAYNNEDEIERLIETVTGD
jgi:selenocysteine lyase/cysteine desulfurase